MVQDGEDGDEDGQDADDQDGDDQQNDNDEQELNIVGGGQQIEEDNYPSEQDLNDQQLTQEQIQQILAMKGGQQALQQQQQMYGVEDVDEDQLDPHQMPQMYIQQKKKKKKQHVPQVAQIMPGGRYQQSRAPNKALVSEMAA